MRHGYHESKVPAARRLRQSLTDAETLAWERLRDRRFHGLKFRRQHPVGAFVLDFYCFELRLAIELDGGIHDTRALARRDAERQRVLEDLGIPFLRIPNEAILSDAETALQAILRICPAWTEGLEGSSAPGRLAEAPPLTTEGRESFAGDGLFVSPDGNNPRPEIAP